jgi:AP-2 complex subunit mu-1
MLSGILIFNQKGENLIFRAFRNDCRPRLADVFRIQVISNAQVRSPILTLGSTTFSHVKHENIYLVAVTKSNANAALVFEFIYRLIGLGKAYFGKFDEEAVKNNFVLVYELLDEILDFGYPQNTETDTLKMYITTEGVKSERAMVGLMYWFFERGSFANTTAGGLFKNHNASHRRTLVAASRHQISKERGVR